MKTPYGVLGVSSAATAREIKRAYRALALLWHPGRNPSADAVARFTEIAEAYAVVMSPNKLAKWRREVGELAFIDFWNADVRMPWDDDTPMPWENVGPSPLDRNDVDLPF